MNVFFVSMGCAKNTVDSERLMGRLVALGHRIVDDPEEADVGIINTCGFIQDAVKENIDAILDLEQMKEEGTLSRIIVVGCLVNRYETELEVLVRSAWRGIRLIPVPIHVYYPPKEERVSHFRPNVDFFRISVLNTIFCILAIVYGYPSMFFHKIFH